MKELLEKATHVIPSAYSRGKHWKGNSEEERRENSKNKGAGQFLFSMTASDVQQLEKTAFLTGEVIDKGSGTYHAYKQFSNPIGYANGQLAHWLRAEMTGVNTGSSPSIHSHPRLKR